MYREKIVEVPFEVIHENPVENRIEKEIVTERFVDIPRQNVIV